MTEDLKNADGKVMIRFIHEAAGLYEDEDENVYETLHTRYQADTWQEACNDAANCWYWDDEDVINFDAESEISETTRDLETIEYQDVNNDWIEVPAEVYEFFEKKLWKIKKSDGRLGIWLRSTFIFFCVRIGGHAARLN